MRHQIRRRLIAPKSRVCRVDANIGDMAEHVSLAVLHNRFAEGAANAPERESDIFVRPTVYGNATDKREAPAIYEVPPDLSQRRAQLGEREIVL